MGEKLNLERPDGDPLIELVVRFNQALNRQDVDTMMCLMTEDCVFENTDPPPEGNSL